jgi:hypothetical protein
MSRGGLTLLKEVKSPKYPIVIASEKVILEFVPASLPFYYVVQEPYSSSHSQSHSGLQTLNQIVIDPHHHLASLPISSQSPLGAY